MCPYQQYKYGPCKQKQINTKSNGAVTQLIFCKRPIYHKIIYNPLTKKSRVLPGNIAGSISCFSHKSIFTYKLSAFPLREKKKTTTKLQSKILSKKQLFEQMRFGKGDKSHMTSSLSVLQQISVLQPQSSMQMLFCILKSVVIAFRAPFARFLG